MRQVLSTRKTGPGHWVGDGFPVRSLFSHMGEKNSHDPFLMLDYAGPHRFDPADRPRGVDVHPHKGFETVTIVYQGEVEHGDSTRARRSDPGRRCAVDDGSRRHPAQGVSQPGVHP